MNALYWSSQGYNRQEVAQFSNVPCNSVKIYIKLYHKGGLEALRSFQYKVFDSVLNHHRLTLEDYFRKHHPRKAKEAGARVRELTGKIYA